MQNTNLRIAKISSTRKIGVIQYLKHEAAITVLRLLTHTFPPISIVRYSFIELKEPKQCEEKEIAIFFERQLHDSNLWSLE